MHFQVLIEGNPQVRVAPGNLLLCTSPSSILEINISDKGEEVSRKLLPMDDGGK